VLVLAVDVPVEHGDVLERRQQAYHLVAVAREPLPVGPQVEERPVGEDHDRGGAGKACEIRPGPRHVVQRDEVDALVQVRRRREAVDDVDGSLERGRPDAVVAIPRE